MTLLVLTVIGDDRAGLVEALAGVVSRHGGNWNRSSMARLGTKFAGIVEVSVTEEGVDALVAELGPLGSQGVLDVTVERVHETAARPRDGARWQLHLIGQDRPGIVHEISQALARNGVSIEELQTSTSSAPMSGEALFEATATLVDTTEVDRNALATDLEALANELMVDLDLTD